MNSPGKRTARVKLTIARRAIDSFVPAHKPWIAWDDKLTGYGVLIHPSGVKSYIVNYRLGPGGRAAPNKRLVIGRCDRMAPELARKEAHRLLGMVAMGEDPAAARTQEPAHALPRAGLRAVHEGQSQAQGDHQPVLPRSFRAAPRRLALASAGFHHARGCGGALQPRHREERLGDGQPVHVSAALGLPPALRGLRWTGPIPSICGSRAAAGSTTSRGARYRRLPRSCRAGGEGSRPW